MKKYIPLILLFSISIAILDIITFKYKCYVFDEPSPYFYGFPFIYRTSIPWANSMSGDFYILGFLGNFIFFLGLTLPIVYIVKSYLTQPLIKKIVKFSAKLCLGVLLFFACTKLMGLEWRYKWKENYFFNNYGGKPMEYERTLEFFKYVE